MNPKESPEYVVRLKALPDAVPAAVRLKRALKCLLRSFGLRAVRVEELPASPEATEGSPDAAGAVLDEATDGSSREVADG
jgi:hypothetical protein